MKSEKIGSAKAPVPSKPAQRMNEVRALAFYLPQFHSIPENDEWWEPGFTEWTQVRRAQPLFAGHRQPKIPHADLGYYDLTEAATRKKQAEIAARHGVAGFCYWHYWFSGRRLLERPFEDVLKTGEPDFPFCLAWANHSWSGVWVGCPDRILLEQTYPGVEDYEQHFKALLPAFRDPRYLKVEGRPLFVVYNPLQLPDCWALVETWDRLARKNGWEGIHFVAIAPSGWPVEPHGFQGFTQPLPNLGARDFEQADPRRTPTVPRRYSYAEALRGMFPEEIPANFYPSILTGWDNTPRCGARGFVLEKNTPEMFEDRVRKACRLVEGRPADQRLIFLKSWNEWSEGNYLEPDTENDYGYLEALKRGLGV
jgi:hypothetical protein